MSTGTYSRGARASIRISVLIACARAIFEQQRPLAAEIGDLAGMPPENGRFDTR